MITKDLLKHLEELKLKPETMLDVMTAHAQKLEDHNAYMLDVARCAGFDSLTDAITVAKKSISANTQAD